MPKTSTFMSLDKARKLAKEVARVRARWGRQGRTAHSVDEVYDAILVLETHGQWDSPTTDELTKVKRQLTASLAREAKLKKQLAGDTADDSAEA